MQDTDIEQCRQLLRGGSRSFHAASLVLPREIRDAATALYAFCRLADDAIDYSDDCDHTLRLLAGRLDRLYAGHPDDDFADRALASIVERFHIPRALPEALLEGFQWDAERRRYQTLEQLCGYGARVAGSVGVMMTLLMRQRDSRVLARASDLGVAMQLTNIARDVGEDARAGRLYLPLCWLREAGVDPDAFMRRPEFSPAIASVVERLLSAAQGLYDRSALGVAHLPIGCRFGIHAARTLYCEIGHEVARRNYDSVSQRAIVPAAAKLRALVYAANASVAMQTVLHLPALPETRFLIEAVPQPQNGWDQPSEFGTAWWNLRARVLRLIELFERQERRKRAGFDQGRATQWGS